jgi:glycosyltransferase involved in cell wall biosynthesis
VPDSTLATIYNAFDVFALPTMAEGFGLPILEAQACGVAALVTDFSACRELVPDEFCRVRVKSTLIMARNFEQAIVDEGELAAKLGRLYADRAELARLGAAGLELARGYSWVDVSAEFVECVKGLVG